MAFAAPPHNKRLLRDLGALPTLVWLLLSGSGAVKAKAAQLLQLLGEDEELRAEILVREPLVVAQSLAQSLA